MTVARFGGSWARESAGRFMQCVVVLALLAQAAAAQSNPQLVKALSYSPLQPDVVYEKVPKDQIDECSIEQVTRAGAQGFWITGPAGQPLRWFADNNGDDKVDQWSYYNAGVEVYRERDRDYDKTADEFRWLGTEGLRIGIDEDEDSAAQIDRWTMISAEEVTAEVVAAASNRDAARFERLLLTPSEINDLGLGTEKQQMLTRRVSDAKEQFEAWVAGQNVVTSSSNWTNFGADKPGVVPAGTDGSEKDIVVYENVVALLENNGDARQLLVGTMIKVGDTWRLVDLPRAVTDGAVVSDAGVFFSASFTPRSADSRTPEMTGGISKAMERLVTDLQDVDTKLASATGSTAQLQARRADVLERLVSASESEEDRSTWVKQFADTVSAAAQAGEYPGGVKRLQDFTRKLGSIDVSDDEVAYVVFRTVTADHNVKMMDPKAKYEDLQEKYLRSLESFVRKYPSSEDSAEAMIQIALSAEFSGKVKVAQGWYQKASRGFADTLAGKKAQGALRRLELVGQRFGLEGNTVDGRQFNSASYLDGPVIYHCWASWCDGCKAEMRALKELQAKFAKQKLRIVGINFDNSIDTAQQFLEQESYPWVHLYDQGGLDSELAVSYGILTLPVNVVVDKNGRVIKTGVHWTELGGVIEDLVK